MTNFIDNQFISKLVSEACDSQRLRKHFNLHTNYSDNLQILLNAIEPASYIAPHRHMRCNKVETLVALCGDMGYVEFNDNGDICKMTRFSANGGKDASRIIVIEPQAWHTIIAFTHGSVLLEIKEGPYVESESKDYPSWRPLNNSSEIEFLYYIRGFLDESN